MRRSLTPLRFSVLGSRTWGIGISSVILTSFGSPVALALVLATVYEGVIGPH